MRAVSPLVAAILLIAFTVTIGAMVIKWGQSFVKQHVNCLAISAFDFLGATKETNKITVTVFYGGETPAGFTGFYIDIVDKSGNKLRCVYNPTAKSPPSGGCIWKVASPAGATQFTPDTTYKIDIMPDTSLIKPTDVVEVDLVHKECGTIFTQYIG